MNCFLLRRTVENLTGIYPVRNLSKSLLFQQPNDHARAPTSVEIQQPVRVGDLFEMVGRQRTVWTVERLVAVPGKGTLAELSQIDGIGRITVKTMDLFAQIQFRKISSATL